MKHFVDTLKQSFVTGIDLGVDLQKTAVDGSLAFLTLLGVPKEQLDGVSFANRKMVDSLTDPFKKALEDEEMTTT